MHYGSHIPLECEIGITQTECGDIEEDVGKFSGMHQTVVDVDA
jgi:hypothetical protein